MINTRGFIFLFAFFYISQVKAFQATATIDINLHNVGTIKYYPPIGNFGNNEIPTFVDSDRYGRISLNVNVNISSLVRFVYGHSTIWLLIERGDSIVINWMGSQVINQFLISGNNYLGHLMYNQKYNVYPSTKFTNLRILFQNESNEEVSIFFSKIYNEFLSQTKWLDSLYQIKSISEKYYELMHKEIFSSLSWETANLIEKYFQAQSDTHNFLMKKLFVLNPMDDLLMSCGMGHAYYDTYYKQLYKWSTTPLDSSMILIDELRYISIAPFDVQKYLWGRSIVTYYTFAPNYYDYCEIYKKYKLKFQNGGYIDQIGQLNFCDKADK